MTPKPRRGGRPALDAAAPSVNVHVRLTAAQYDAAYSRAAAARVTLADWIRRAVQHASAPADKAR